MAENGNAQKLGIHAEAYFLKDGRLIIEDSHDVVILSESEVLKLERFLRDRPAPF